MTELVKSIRILPRWIIVAIDAVIIAFSGILAYFLRFNFIYPDLVRAKYLFGVTVITLVGTLAILVTKSYAGIVRYTGLQDGFRVCYSSALSMFVLVLVNVGHYSVKGANLVPYSVIIIAFMASFFFLFFYRLFVKSIFSYYSNIVGTKSNVIIFGAGESGIITKQVIDTDTTSNLRVVAFLEDNDQKTGKKINGTKIFNARRDMEQVMEDYEVSELIISIKSLALDRKNEIVDTCLKHNIKVRNVPAVEKWVSGELSLNQIKEVKIEDLLGRQSIQLDNLNVSNELIGKVICITGAAGSIGSEIVRQVLLYSPKKVILLDQAESPLYELEREVFPFQKSVDIISVLSDISDRDALEQVFHLHRPDLVFHAAAYKHVPMMENNTSEAVKCNIMGTKNLADIANECGVAKFVMISTDKAVNPTNVMGCSKRIAEIYVQSLNYHNQGGGRSTRFITTRFGNVLGSNGSVIPYFKKQIAAGGPLTVTHPEITRYFMTIPEACQLVLEAGAMGKGGEIFIFDMGASIKIVDLANKMIKLSGLVPGKDIQIVYTGLREGEKLYEELLSNTENTIPTHHKKIMIARVEAQDYAAVDRDLKKLKELVDNHQEMNMVSLMKKMVPEFISNSSKFESLDRKKSNTAEKVNIAL